VAIVLVVDDDEEIRVLAESILKDAGHTAMSAIGAAGAEALLSMDLAIDVLFIDIKLGADVEAGLHVAKAAVKRRPNLRLVYTTGQGVTDGMRAMFVEPFHFIAKPYTAEQVRLAVNSAFAK
jgi:DNA-binding NtrC family response regulator